MNQSPTAVVLVMHGGIPKDFPKTELQRFRKARQQGAAGNEEAQQLAERIETKMRQWPRSEENDAYYRGSKQLRDALEKDMQVPVILAFNEFCSPTLEEAVVRAVEDLGAKNVRVITPMLTRGGRHSEYDIPDAIHRAKSQIDDPDVTVDYVWPVDPTETAAFLARQIRAHDSTQ